MDGQTAIATVGQAIQLSVAPVFLLSSIGGMLAVLTSRLARVVDRALAAEARMLDSSAGDRTSSYDRLDTLGRRAQLVNQSITLCTITALLVCMVVATMFVGAFLHVDTSVPVAGLFIGAMTSFIAGLICFLREIFLATDSLRIGGR
jgi:hypothetical protein